MKTISQEIFNETLNHLICIYEFTQKLYGDGVHLLAKSFGFKTRAFSKNVQALVSLGYLISGGGKPLQIQWSNPEKKVTNELVEEVVYERRRIDRENHRSPRKQENLIEVLERYSSQEVRDAYLQYLRNHHTSTNQNKSYDSK